MNRRFLLGITFLVSVISFPLQALAKNQNISSVSERERAVSLGVQGPGETKGINSEVLAMIPLAEEFEAMQGYSLRSRRISVAPGGVIAVHQHQSRPGILYMLEGEMTEHRSDSDTPLTQNKIKHPLRLTA